MATLSVREIASRCLGVSGRVSVTTHMYGYAFRDTDGSVFGTLGTADTLPGTGLATARSLRRHLVTITGDATDLVVILVGHENDFSGSVTRDQVTKIQYAIQIARDIYAQANLGIRHINWQRIGVTDAGNYITITDGAEAEDLTDDWSGPNGGIDVFFVQSIGDAGGWSNTNGPCDKGSKDGRTGAVIELNRSRRFTGILVGHEVGHYLGLGHDGTLTNLMGVDSNNDGIGELNNNSTGVTATQASTMGEHCSVRGSCREER
jgi:hypothetical protein